VDREPGDDLLLRRFSAALPVHCEGVPRPSGPKGGRGGRPRGDGLAFLLGQ